MLRTISIYGLIAGILTAAPLFSFVLFQGAEISSNSQIVGYAIMLAALSLVFVAVKNHRDKVGGGIIKFLPAFLMGLGISAVAGVVYVIGWEIVLAATDFAFIENYSASLLESARASGATQAELDRTAAEIASFSEQYRNPLFRMPLTFIEIFPVGLIVSLITAALLRNSRFLPARASPAA